MDTGTKITYYKSKNRADIVTYFYEQEDSFWHKNIHKNGGTMEENVKSTLDTIIPDTMFSVYVGNEIAAFFTKYENGDDKVLDGWHIGKKFRNAEFLPQFWAIVKEVFESKFLTGVYEKNTPAIDHLYRQGFAIQNKIQREEGNLVILTHKN